MLINYDFLIIAGLLVIWALIIYNFFNESAKEKAYGETIMYDQDLDEYFLTVNSVGLTMEVLYQSEFPFISKNRTNVVEVCAL